MSAVAETPTPPRSPAKPRSRRWSPRFLQGTDAITWARLIWRSRFTVHPRYWYIAGIVSPASTMNLVFRWIQNSMYGEELARTNFDKQPLFVIGHWRTGTTLLHELLIQDPQFNYPDFFACFNPNHRLLTERFFKTYAKWMAPEQRPMDNMAAGWDRPQEDEFALCLLGLPSTYIDVAFPQSAPMYPGSLDLSGLSPSELKHWKRSFVKFLQTISFRDDRRLVLKSPPHTARIPTLLDLFPDARFLHIVRDPYVVFPSTVNLWNSLTSRQCLQTPPKTGTEEKVLREFRVIYDRLEEARPLLKPGRFHELRYEELVKNPVGEMQKVYAALELEGYDEAQLRIEQYVKQTTGYETNKYAITPEQREKVKREWGDVIRRYGYG
ncbi:MAG: sulfotransferase [Planctomycetes bacterium]|nr:sulfotransferase [Planctomycetota bacterium]